MRGDTDPKNRPGTGLDPSSPPLRKFTSPSPSRRLGSFPGGVEARNTGRYEHTGGWYGVVTTATTVVHRSSCAGTRRGGQRKQKKRKRGPARVFALPPETWVVRIPPLTTRNGRTGTGTGESRSPGGNRRHAPRVILRRRLERARLICVAVPPKTDTPDAKRGVTPRNQALRARRARARTAHDSSPAGDKHAHHRPAP